MVTKKNLQVHQADVNDELFYVRCKQTAKLLTLTGFLCSFTNERSELKFIAFFG